MNECPNPHSRRITKTKWEIHKSNIFGVIVQGNGVRKYVMKCPQCQSSLGDLSKPVAAEMMRRGWQPVIVRVYPAIEYKTCAYRDCQNPGIDMHHWAPRNVFGYWDCDNWPVSYLCKEHHQQWHRQMDGYGRNAKRSDEVEKRDRFLDSESGAPWLFQSNMLAEVLPEWGTTALDPLYRLQTIRNLDELLLADEEVMEVGA